MTAPSEPFINFREVEYAYRLLMRRAWNRARMRLASWIMGGGWSGVIMRLWLVEHRARAAIQQDGGVILANCKPLADALYENIPGRWRLTVELIEDQDPGQSPGHSKNPTEDGK